MPQEVGANFHAVSLDLVSSCELVEQLIQQDDAAMRSDTMSAEASCA
jgi:hypothetical protein